MSGREPGRKTEETGHDYVRDRLSEYLDGQLLGQERQAVEEHLAACGSCRWQLQTLRQTVLWTRNLPTMPVPRSFTLPVPAAVPARSARPRWRLVPAFQLATAMVALLLFFAVAGDMALTGMRPASMPAPSLMQREAAEQVVETVGVEAEAPEETMALQAVPAEPEPESAAEKAAEGAARMLATEVPLLEEAPMAAAAAPEVTAVPDLAATQTAAPPGMGGGLPDFEDTPLPPSEEPGATTYAVPETVSDRSPETPGIAAEVPVTVEAAEPVTAAEATQEMAAMALPEPQVSPAPQAAVPPQSLATPVPPLAAPGEESLSGPEVEVQVEEPLEALAASEPSAGDLGERASDEVRDAHALQGQATNWLRLIQYALAALLVLLVGTTAALMVWRRRAE